MMEDRHKEYQEFDDIESKPTKKKIKAKFIKDIADGSVLTNKAFVSQLPFMVFLAFLGILYISNSYQAEKLVRYTRQLENELRQLQPEAIAISSELMQQSNQSEVARLVKNKNLRLIESREPPIKIVVEKDEIK